ncbi:MAG: hypothetical protein SVS85_03515, partial [Candidatus Nanohaloarchaea archaeon]|nr:hypothetical protein [Candidatus Nanohaloarchaea archaeon]
MPSLEEIAENSAAVAIAELLEPEDVESRRVRASEIAGRAGYEPGQISRAWKEADLGGYDVDIQRLGRDGQTLIWEVSYDADSDSLPSCPPDEEVSGREKIWTRFRERLGDHGATLQDRGVLDSDFTEVYLDVVERIRKDEQEEVKLLNRVADH